MILRVLGGGVSCKNDAVGHKIVIWIYDFVTLPFDVTLLPPRRTGLLRHQSRRWGSLRLEVERAGEAVGCGEDLREGAWGMPADVNGYRFKGSPPHRHRARDTRNKGERLWFYNMLFASK